MIQKWFTLKILFSCSVLTTSLKTQGQIIDARESRVIYFFPAHLDFPSPPLSAPGCPRIPPEQTAGYLRSSKILIHVLATQTDITDDRQNLPLIAVERKYRI